MGVWLPGIWRPRVQGNEDMEIVRAGCRVPWGGSDQGQPPTHFSRPQGTSPARARANRGAGPLEGPEQEMPFPGRSLPDLQDPPLESGFLNVHS